MKSDGQSGSGRSHHTVLSRLILAVGLAMVVGGCNGSAVSRDDSGQEKRSSTTASAVETMDEFKTLFPDMESVPSGWSLKTHFNGIVKPQDCTLGPCAPELRFWGNSTFENISTDTSVTFQAWAYDSVESAAVDFRKMTGIWKSHDGVVNTPMELPPLGDESKAVWGEITQDSKSYYGCHVMARISTVVIDVQCNPVAHRIDPEAPASMAKAMVDRVAEKTGK